MHHAQTPRRCNLPCELPAPQRLTLCITLKADSPVQPSCPRVQEVLIESGKYCGPEEKTLALHFAPAQNDPNNAAFLSVWDYSRYRNPAGHCEGAVRLMLDERDTSWPTNAKRKSSPLSPSSHPGRHVHPRPICSAFLTPAPNEPSAAACRFGKKPARTRCVCRPSLWPPQEPLLD